MREIIGIDFFCGCGGTSLGLKQAGINVVRGIDFDNSCKEIYEENMSGANFLNADISTLKPENVLKGIKKKKSDLLLFSACAPCQPFSSHNRAGKKGKDSRINLLMSFSKFVSYHRPDFIFIENVPGIQNIKGSNVFQKFLKSISSLDYKFVFKVVDAKEFGVPQSRKRLILLASNIPGVDLSLPAETHGPDKKPYATVREAIANLPIVKHGKEHSINGHKARMLSELNYTRIQNTAKNGGDRLSWPRNLWLDCHKKNKGHNDVYGRMFWDRPAPTLTCKCTSITNGRYGHPTQNRGITPREAALLQSFPKDYKLFGGLDQMTRHIGNAVPPLLAKSVGLKIIELSKDF